MAPLKINAMAYLIGSVLKKGIKRKPMENKSRPLSPHLQVFNQHFTGTLSILHRITGIGMVFGLAVFIWWLVALSLGGQAYGQFLECLSSIPGKILLFGWGWALSYHFCTGVRHLIWDMGYGFEKPTIFKSAYAVIFLSTVLTLLVWASAWGVL